ncbi:MAG: hypothetical protein O3C40_01325 [Planctomycetota bacterium]|nr:hypothetical protein [Planctomycetota bacterium]
MNTAIFWRLVWKEYRQQRALWTAIALAGLIFQAAVLIYCSLNGVADLSNRLFTVALSVPVLYSLGCGAALFAGEHEAETFPFQQSLPVSAGRVFFAKFAFGTVSALLLFPVLWLLAFAMASWQLPDATWHLELWAGGIVTTLEVLVWAVLGSLVLRRVLPAAIVSGVTVALLGCGSLSLTVAFQDLYEHQVNEYFSTLPLRACVALLTLFVAAKFGRQWFNERPIHWTSPATRLARLNAAIQSRSTPATRLTVFTRLMWHEWRQGRTTMFWCVLGYVVLGSWMAISQLGPQAYLGLLPVLATIIGANAFAADQRQGQYQFFTEHGVRPQLVWLSRQVAWAAILIAMATFAVSLQAFERRQPFDYTRTTSAVSIGFALVMFASGQLCSILIRSGIVAVFTAALCSILLYLWTGFMVSLGVPWMLCALPLPFMFFWASWLFAPKWIQQRQTWRVRIITAATIIAPLLCVVAATAAYRVYEIPAVKLSFDPAIRTPDASPAARETASMYREADSLLRPHLAFDEADATTISSRDSGWQEGIDLFIAASQRATCRFHHWDDETRPPSVFDGKQLTRGVLAEAKARAEEGDLQGAAELHDGLLRLTSHFYQQHSEEAYRLLGLAVEQQLYPVLPAWADHRSVNLELLQEALERLRTWSAANPVDWEASVTEHRHNAQRLIALEDRAMRSQDEMDATQRNAFKTLGSLLPWERWRMSRLLDVYTEAELQGIREIRARGPRIPPKSQSILPWDVQLTLSNGRRNLIRSTDVETWLMTSPWLDVVTAQFAVQLVAWEQENQVQRNAVQLQLALIAWRKQNGELPDSLHQLLGDTFETLPLDPYSKDQFVYFPNGVDEEFWDDDAMGMGNMDAAGGVMPMLGEGLSPPRSPHPLESEGMGSMLGEGLALGKPRLVRSEPFLWSPGAQLRYAPGTHRGPSGSPIASDFRDQNGNVLSDQILLHQGVRYPIPQAKQQPPDSSGDADALPNDE